MGPDLQAGQEEPEHWDLSHKPAVPKPRSVSSPVHLAEEMGTGGTQGGQWEATSVQSWKQPRHGAHIILVEEGELPVAAWLSLLPQPGY